MFHGVFLQPIYLKTAEMWRSQEDCIFPALAGGQFLMTLFLCLLYAGCCRATSIKNGLTFGLLIGLFSGAPHLIVYAVQPLPVNLVVYWIIGGIIEFTLAGLLLGAIYRPVAPPSA